MDRLACVSVPELPLQLLMREHPEWRGTPVVVVDEDSPRGVVQWANRVARRGGIHVGMRYAVALSLCTELRAGVVKDSRIAESVDELHGLLRRFSPLVEAHAAEPGVFWLDASGLHHLYASLREWACAVHREVSALHECAIAVGFDRLSVCAVAKSRALFCSTPPVVAFDDVAAESAQAHGVGLRDLGLSPAVCDTLDKLGVTTLRDFVALPASGVCERFGLEAFRLHQSAAKIYPQRLTQTPYALPVSERLMLDEAESDLTRLTFGIKSSLDALVRALGTRGEALANLTIELTLEKRRGLTASQRRLRTDVSPAVPTLDVVQLTELTRLRLEALQLPAGVTDVLLTATSVPASDEQLGLFAAGDGRRDLAAAGRALARLRAELGEDAVVRPVLRDAHLPEAQFAWEPVLTVSAPIVAPAARRRPLVRRFFPAATPLAAMPRTLRNDGWQPLGPSSGAVADMQGPYVVSGGWWRREVQRHYYFVTLTDEEIVWIYLDLARRQWFLQGRVE